MRGRPASRGALLYLLLVAALELGGLRGAGEGDDVADVGHAGDKEQQALEAQAEAGVRAGAVATRVEVPPHVLHRDVEFLDAAHQLVVVLLTDAAADDLADLREEHVGALYGEAGEALTLALFLHVVVELHVEGLDFLRVVDHDDRLLEVFFHQVALVLACQIHTPTHRELELLAVFDGLFQYLDAFGVGQTHKLGVYHAAQALDEAVVDHLVEELEVIHAVVEGPADAVFDELLLEGRQLVHLVEGHLRLDHPELGQVARGVAVLGAEGGAEGVDLAQRGGAELAFELAADGEGGELAEEVLLPVDGAVLLAGRVLGVEGRDVEHLAGTLAVAGGDERRVEVEEAALVEEGVDGHGHVVAQTHDGAEGVGAQAQVAYLAQELHAVSLLLQWVGVGVGLAVDDDALGLHLDGLAASLALHQLALHADAGTGGDAAQLFLELLWVCDDLDIVDDGAVVDGKEGDILVATLGADPSLYAYRSTQQGTYIFFQQIFNLVTFHCIV